MLKKLLSNFFDKEMYVLHYENIQLYIQHILNSTHKKNRGRIKMEAKMEKECTN